MYVFFTAFTEYDTKSFSSSKVTENQQKTSDQDGKYNYQFYILQ